MEEFTGIIRQNYKYRYIEKKTFMYLTFIVQFRLTAFFQRGIICVRLCCRSGSRSTKGAITTTAGPAEEVAAAVDFLMERLGVTGVAVDEFAAFAEVFGRVIFVVESAAGVLDWTAFEFPIGQR
jgi:hypothetical protein